MKYTACWTANGSTRGQIEGNNKRNIIRDVRDICEGNIFHGSFGEWRIYDNTRGCKEVPIARRNYSNYGVAK